jgi:hypothetical protein
MMGQDETTYMHRIICMFAWLGFHKTAQGAHPAKPSTRQYKTAFVESEEVHTSWPATHFLHILAPSKLRAP